MSRLEHVQRTRRIGVVGSPSAVALASMTTAVLLAASAFGQAPAAPEAAPTQPAPAKQINDPAKVRELISNTAPSKSPRADDAKPEQPPIDPNAKPVIVFDPPVADMGEMAVDVAETVTVKIRNVHSEPIRITKATASCGCTTPVWPKDPIPPGGEADCQVTLKPGSQQGLKLSKKVTFTIDGHNPVVLSVEGDVVAYVKVSPNMLDAPSEVVGAAPAGGEITLESADGTAFRVTELNPPVVKSLPTEPALKHVLPVDWANWAESGRSPKILIRTDHPKAPQLTMLVKRTMAQGPTPPEGPRAPAGPGTTDLITAVRAGDMAKISSLIASGVDVNERDRAGQRTALHWAAKTGSVAALEALIAAKADPNVKDRQGRTPLWLAVESNVDVVRYLVEQGADVNARDVIKSTPLLWASGLGQPESVEYLLSKGADVKAVDDNGWTALIWAAGLGQPRTVEILVNAKADITASDRQTGDTPLLRGARTGKPESLRILLGAGADVKAVNTNGQTALHLAAASGSADKVKLLLEAKADPAATDKRGWAPIDHAMARTTGDKTKLLEVLKPVSPAPKPQEQASTKADAPGGPAIPAPPAPPAGR